MTSERRSAIRDHMQSTHAAIVEIIDTLTEEDWNVPVYSPGHEAGWTVRDVVAHLADSTTGQLGVTRRVAAGENPIPADFDLQRWNRRAVQKSADKSTSELSAAVVDNFANWLTLLEEIPEADLDRRGRHASGAELTVEGMFRRFTQHEANHAHDIRAALAGK